MPQNRQSHHQGIKKNETWDWQKGSKSKRYMKAWNHKGVHTVSLYLWAKKALGVSLPPGTAAAGDHVSQSPWIKVNRLPLFLHFSPNSIPPLLQYQDIYPSHPFHVHFILNTSSHPFILSYLQTITFPLIVSPRILFLLFQPKSSQYCFKNTIR